MKKYILLLLCIILYFGTASAASFNEDFDSVSEWTYLAGSNFKNSTCSINGNLCGNQSTSTVLKHVLGFTAAYWDVKLIPSATQQPSLMFGESLAVYAGWQVNSFNASHWQFYSAGFSGFPTSYIEKGHTYYRIILQEIYAGGFRWAIYSDEGNLLRERYFESSSTASRANVMIGDMMTSYKDAFYDDLVVSDNPEFDPTTLSNTSIVFNAESYALNSTATVSYNVLTPDFTNWNYKAELLNPLGEVAASKTMTSGSSNPDQFTYPMNLVGTWRAHLWACYPGNGSCPVFLEYDIANVSDNFSGQGGMIKFYSDISETNLITAIDNGNTAYMNVTANNIDTSKYIYEVLITNPDGIGVDKENVIISPQSFIVDTSYPFYIRSGSYKFRLVATDIQTGTSQILAVSYLSILDDYPGSGRLNFSKNNYSLGEQMNISYIIGQANFAKYAYSIELYGVDNTLQGTMSLGSASGTISPVHDKTKIGSYSAWLYAQKYGSVSKQLMKIATTQYGSVAGGVSGNLSLDKSTYNRTENVQIYYNISTSGRINIQTPTTMFTYAVTAGTGQQKTFYVPQDASFGTYTVYLEYFDGTFWTYIDHETFTVTYIGQNMIEFSEPRKLYVQGDTMTVNAIGTDSGYIIIRDSNSMIKLNATITANSLTSYNYYVAFTDPAGIWTAKLYNSTGAEVATDSADVYTSGYGQPSPTATVPSVTSTSGTIDYVGNKTARKDAENSFLNTFYNGMNGLFTLAILATIMFLLKDMSKWK